MMKKYWKDLFSVYRCAQFEHAREHFTVSELELIARYDSQAPDKLAAKMVNRYNAKELAQESGIRFGSLIRCCMTNKLKVNAVIAWITGDWAWGVTESDVDDTCLHFYNAAVSTGAFSGTCSEFCYHTYTAEFVANFINIER